MFKVANKEIETYISVFGGNNVCLVSSCNYLLLKWHYYILIYVRNLKFYFTSLIKPLKRREIFGIFRICLEGISLAFDIYIYLYINILTYKYIYIYIYIYFGKGLRIHSTLLQLYSDSSFSMLVNLPTFHLSFILPVQFCFYIWPFTIVTKSILKDIKKQLNTIK